MTFIGRPALEQLVSQTCTASQFGESHYTRLCAEINQPPQFHRKQWEYVYILRALEQFSLLRPGVRGLGFGCGKEPLAVVMAKHGVDIVVTDIPPPQPDPYWGSSSARDLFWTGICSEQQYIEHVTFRAVDMTAIPPELGHYDFCWSCCALEHLGSLQAGMDFIVNSSRNLKPGGIAIHTTELNVSSDTETMETPELSLYRRKDLLDLQETLANEGCSVLPLNFYSGNLPQDKHVDLPPYKLDVHLKLQVESFTITSFGLVIRRDQPA
jgi:SAM-dependent methyltransferase